MCACVCVCVCVCARTCSLSHCLVCLGSSSSSGSSLLSCCATAGPSIDSLWPLHPTSCKHRRRLNSEYARPRARRSSWMLLSRTCYFFALLKKSKPSKEAPPSGPEACQRRHHLSYKDPRQAVFYQPKKKCCDRDTIFPDIPSNRQTKQCNRSYAPIEFSAAGVLLRVFRPLTCHNCQTLCASSLNCR